MCDIDRDGKISLNDIEKFFNIQIKYRQNINEKFKYKFINEFTRLKLHNLTFSEFFKKISSNEEN